MLKIKSNKDEEFDKIIRTREFDTFESLKLM